MWGDSDTFLFHTVIWAFSVKLFADRSALSICGLISWESPPRKRRLSPKARRALQLPAHNPFGVNEDLSVSGHEFSRGMTAGLIRAGFALRYRVPLTVGGRAIEVPHVRITEAGRREIEG